MGVQEVLKRKTGVIVGDDVYALCTISVTPEEEERITLLITNSQICAKA